MVKHLDKFAIKKVIDALKEKSMTWGELKESLKLPEKTLSRILTEYLALWGFAEKDEKTQRWVWHERAMVYKTRNDYELAINHSRKLLKGLHALHVLIKEHQLIEKRPIKLDVDKMTLYGQAAKEHLKTGYPEIYDQMIKFEDAVHEAENLSEELKTYAEEGPLKKLDDLISRIRIFMIDEKRYDKRYRRDLQKLVRNIPKEKFNTISEVGSNETRLTLQFASDINFLVTKVEMGEPLHGSCNLCPDVIIKNHEK